MATAAQLDVIIRAQDQASRVLKGVQREFSGMNVAMTALGVAGGLSMDRLAGKVADFAINGLREFSEAEKVMGQTEAALKSTGGAAGVTADHIGDLADKYMKLAAVDDEVIQSAENVLLTFTNVRNVGVDKVFDQASLAALNLSARMGTDLQSAIVLVGKALNDPIKGTTALSKAGVQLTQSQKDMIRQFVEAGDVMSAQKIILKELETQFGGSAEAAGDTFAGQLKILQLRFENLQGEVMGNVVPALLAFSGFVEDTTVAVGKLIDKIGEIKEPFEGAFGFISDTLDLIPDEIKDVAVAAAMLSNPLTAAAGIGAGLTRVIDHFSDSSDDATQSTNDFATALENAQGRAMMAQSAVNNARSAISGPMAASGIRDSLQGLADDAYAARDAADKARRAFFDLLNQPSQERQTREALLAQAQLNVGKLEQQGGKEGLLSPERQGWYEWLINTFIPAQEDWLRLDELRTDRDEKAAVLAETLTGDYKNMWGVIDGRLLPGMDRYNTALYNATGNMQNLQKFNPASLEVKTKVDKPPDPSKIKPELRTYINDVNEWLKQWPFNWGFDNPPFPPRQMTKNEARSFIKDVNDFLDDLPFNWHIPEPKFPKQGELTPKLRTVINAVNDFFDHTPFLWHIPVPPHPTLSDITPPLRTLIADTNTFFDSTPFNWHIPTPWAPPDSSLKQKVQDIIDRIRYWWSQISPFGGMTFNPTTLETAQALKPQLSAAVNRPDNRGMTLGPGSGGGWTGNLIVHFNGQADLGTPTGRQYIADRLYQALSERMRAG